MTYELQTIPVWRAIEAKTPCLLCHLEAESEERNVAFFLGNAMMAPEMRVQVNEHGFCRRHLHLLARGQGKLGYSLGLETHLESLGSRLGPLEDRLVTAAPRGAQKAAAAYAEALRDAADDCLMCRRIAANMANFTFTVARLYLDSDDFAPALRESDGFCLRHLPDVIRMGAEVVPARRLAEWHELIVTVQRAAIARNREHLEQFTWQFDYQTEKRTPPEAQDAVPRAVGRLAGRE